MKMNIIREKKIYRKMAKGRHGKICNDKFIVNLPDSSAHYWSSRSLFLQTVLSFETRYERDREQ